MKEYQHPDGEHLFILQRGTKCACGVERASASDQTSERKLRDLLERLAPETPMNQDEQGGCVWCDGSPPGSPGGYARRERSHHAADCPWVAARDYLGDTLP